ncbi:MAG TPA: hypothetical protein VNS10_09225 [Gemmatimonadaceae bacterium]|jgi:hypothetical protein|nr:hypothetical protein [Gemmatimonadaceae bacterium]
MLSRLRARATAKLGLIWAAAFAAVGLSMALRTVLLARPALRLVVVTDTLRYTMAWGVVGGICGLSFSVALVALARHQTLERLPSLRISLLSALVGFGIGAAGDPGYRAAILLALVAAALAFGSLQMAKHARAGQSVV